MTDGKYLYCILDGVQDNNFGNVGLFGKKPYTVVYKDISAVLSNIPFKEIKPEIDVMTLHQRVIDESRSYGTVLPARFGTIFRFDDGVKKMLAESYKDLRSKITRLRGKDEYGLKIIIDKSDLKKIELTSHNAPEVKKIKKEMVSAGEGTAYFLKMKMNEAIRNHTYKKIETLSGQIHDEIVKTSKENCLLKSDFDEIVLNASYLVNRDEGGLFHKKLDQLKEKYEALGLTFHLSGPWAPYSFC
jgi:hypothetical protein